jgi:RHS repeat-associated protein/uncharacterized repeat protein (TIGR01451 family)
VVGTEEDCDNGPVWGKLDEETEATGGACWEVPDPADLPEAMETVFRPEIVAVRVSVEGGTETAPSEGTAPGLPYQAFGTMQGTHEATVDANGTTICFEVDVDADGATHTIGECVTVRLNTAPVAAVDAATIVVDEGSVAELSVEESSDEDLGDVLSFLWELVTVTGLPQSVAADSEEDLAFAAFDEGSYEATVTVSDGWAQDAAGAVITVRNVSPVADVFVQDGIGEGNLVTVSGTVTDAGIFDVHLATLDWGDESGPETIPMSHQGAGWGTFVAGHAYEDAGNYTITVTVTDGDGGVTIEQLSAKVGTSVAVWAGSESLRKSLEWSGCSGTITGRVHSNHDLWIGGGGKAIEGVVTAVGEARLRGEPTLSEGVETGTVETPPLSYAVADYAPASPLAVALGLAYVNATGSCSSGVWTIDEALDPGVYYADCDIVVDEAGLVATLVATGTVTLEEGAGIVAYTDNLAALAGSTDDGAIAVTGDDVSVYGYLAAMDGGVEVGGANFTQTCGILGDRVDLAGSGTTIDAVSCLPSGSVPVPPRLIPQLALTLDTSPSLLYPGEEVTADATVTYVAAKLLSPAMLGLLNDSGSAVTVTGVSATVSARSLSTDPWTSIELPLSFVATGVDVGASTYELDDETTPSIPDGVQAYWVVEASIDAEGEDLTTLMTAAVGGELEATLSLELSSTTGVTTFVHTGRLELGEEAAELTEVEVTVLASSGAVTVLPSGDENGELEPEGEGEAQLVAGPSVLAPKATMESDADYLDRIEARDESPVTTGAYATAQFLTQPSALPLTVTAPLAWESGALQVPVLRITPPDVPVEATVSDVLDLTTGLMNTGSVTASNIVVARTVAGTAVPHAFPTSLASGVFEEDEATFEIEEPLAGTLPAVVVTASWTDAVGNVYGPIAPTSIVEVPDVPALTVTLADPVGLISEEDPIDLVLTLTNDSGVSVTSVVAVIALDAEVTADDPLVSAQSQGTSSTVTPGGVTTVTLNFGTIAASASASATISVIAPDDVGGEVLRLVHQAIVSSPDLDDDVLSDDVDEGKPGLGDATITPVRPSGAAVSSLLAWQLLNDADSNTVPSPGDTIRLRGVLANDGQAAQADVTLSLPLPLFTELVSGSYYAESGSPTWETTGGAHLEATWSSLGATTDHLFGFDVVLQYGAAAQGYLSAQAAFDLDGVSTVYSDNPYTEATVGDATIVAVSDTPFPDDLPPGSWPLVTITAPEDGARGAGALAIEALLEPNATTEAPLVWWRVMVLPGNGSFASGETLAFELVDDGNPTTPHEVELPDDIEDPEVEAGLFFDTTTWPNGVYRVRVEVADTNGQMGYAEHAVEVTGSFKPGRYRMEFPEGSVPLEVGEVSLTRVYDSLDRRTHGDFGYGWSLQLADFRIETNGKLGTGPWAQESCSGSGYGTSTLCTVSPRPHMVVVTWPDGSSEVFDFTPSGGSSIGGGLMTPAFTPKYGSTNTLKVKGGYLLSVQDGNLYGSGPTSGIFDPPTFILETEDGTKYTIDRVAGLKKVEDRFGNSLEVTPDGLISDGPGVSFERDAYGRIESMVFAGGTADEATRNFVYNGGDLALSVDGEGYETAYTYAEGEIPHLLEGWQSEGSSGPAVVVTYDEDGRVERVVDGAGADLTQSWSLEPGSLSVTRVSPSEDTLTTLTTDEANRLRLTTVEHYSDAGDLERIDEVFRPPGAGSDATYSQVLTYDEVYRVEEIERLATPPGGSEVSRGSESWTFDEAGRVLTHTGMDNVVTTTTYGPHGQVDTVTVGGVLIEDNTFDAETGQLEGRIEGQTYTYYDDGRLHVGTLPTGQAMTITYTGGLPTSVVLSATGTSEIRTITSAYDTRGRLASVTSPRDTYDDPHTVAYTYDANGQTLTKTDERSQVQSFVYDDQGRLSEYRGKLEQPSGTPVSYEYDDAGQLIQKTNRAGDVVELRYDEAGNLVEVEKVSGPSAATHKTFQYDALRRMTQAVDVEAGVTITRTYDDRGLLSEVMSGADVPSTTITYDRHGSGRTTNTTYAGRDVDYGYDPTTGQLSTMSDPDLGVFEFDYDALARPSKLTRNRGAMSIKTVTAYDDIGKIEALITQISGTEEDTGTIDTDGYEPAYGYALAYDPWGLPWERTVTVGVTDAITEYTHDAAGRLTSADHPVGGSEDEAYTYDEAGRRTSSDSVTATYNNGDQLTGHGSCTYAYDDEGRRESKTCGSDVTSYTWDALDRLLVLSEPDGTVWRYVYDAMDRRVRVEVETPPVDTATPGTAEVRAFQYDEKLAVAVWEWDGAAWDLVEDYLVGSGFGEVLAREKSDGVAYALRDHLQTPVAWVGADGSLVEVVRDSFGMRADDGVGVEVVEPYGFTGHAEDGSRLVWGRQRYYDSQSGSWLHEDPVRDTSRYCAMDNAPTVRSDPSGLMAVHYGKELKQANCRGAKMSLYGEAPQDHHIATHYGDRGREFGRLFDMAGMSIHDATNMLKIYGHYGPHPDAYHEHVHQRIQDAYKNVRERTSRSIARPLSRRSMKFGRISRRSARKYIGGSRISELRVTLSCCRGIADRVVGDIR